MSQTSINSVGKKDLFIIYLEYFWFWNINTQFLYKKYHVSKNVVYMMYFTVSQNNINLIITLKSY